MGNFAQIFHLLKTYIPLAFLSSYVQAKDFPLGRRIYMTELLNWFMPTVLYISGWRLFFYSNEGTEPIHIHAQKGDMECKFWILSEEVDIQEAFSYNLNISGRREIRKIIFKNFDLIVDSWNSYFKKIK